MAVRALKRFAADYAVRTGYLPPSRAPANDGEKVAIVGSGPAGLMSAYRLANKGYDVTVFEALDVPGGALAACIPDYRLPRDMLLRDVENIKRAGVKIKTNTRIGKDISFERLRSDYRAVFIATGAHKSRKLGIPNEDAEGILDSMEFLRMLIWVARSRSVAAWGSSGEETPQWMRPGSPSERSLARKCRSSIAVRKRKCPPSERKWKLPPKKASNCNC